MCLLGSSSVTVIGLLFEYKSNYWRQTNTKMNRKIRIFSLKKNGFHSVVDCSVSFYRFEPNVQAKTTSKAENFRKLDFPNYVCLVRVSFFRLGSERLARAGLSPTFCSRQI